MRPSLALLGLATLVAPPVSGEPPRSHGSELWAKLEARIQAVDARLDGVLGVFVKDLTNGAVVRVRPDHVFPLASAIKVAVVYELYRQAEEGRIDLAEITRPPLPRVGGGGVLQELGGDVSLTWRDLAVLMMAWSDNEAANVLIGRVGMDSVNQRLRGLGLRGTRLKRRMMDLEAARRGDENVGTPAEMAQMLEHVYRGTDLSAARAKDLADVIAVTKWSDSQAGIPFRGPLPPTLRVLDKAGELEGVRCVSAAVDLPGRPYVAAIMTTFLRRESDGEAAIREISAAVYETFDRLARGSEHGRLIGEK